MSTRCLPVLGLDDVIGSPVRLGAGVGAVSHTKLAEDGVIRAVGVGGVLAPEVVGDIPPPALVAVGIGGVSDGGGGPLGFKEGLEVHNVGELQG
eukprot:754251-Hanusia_phi.AAC.2